LFGDLIEHWERPSAKARERIHPDKLDRAKLLSLTEKYGYDDIATALRERGGLPDQEQAYFTGGIDNVDDFSACKITRKEDWVDLYAKPYYFGCEADDRMNAFGRNNPVGAKLNAIFSSISGISTGSTCATRCPKPMSWSRMVTSLSTIFATSPSPTWCGCGYAEPEILRGHARRQTGRRRAAQSRVAQDVIQLRLPGVRALCVLELCEVCILGMISVLRRHLVSPETGVERIDLFLRFDLGLAGGEILAGEDRLTGGNVGLAVDANTEE
jgi:hypothetical protein